MPLTVTPQVENIKPNYKINNSIIRVILAMKTGFMENFKVIQEKESPWSKQGLLPLKNILTKTPQRYEEKRKREYYNFC